MNKHLIISSLLGKKLLNSENATFTPLAGGVSSDIYLLTDGENSYVVKQARSKLKVEDDWFADPARNLTEQEFVLYVRTFLPHAVPRMLYRDPGNGFFVMEYLDASYKNWKEQLLQGELEQQTAHRAAGLLACIHRYSRKNRTASKRFDTTSNFKSLRIDPYLVTTGRRHPGLNEMFVREAKRLENHREALVHGDFSPKNIMVGPGRIVLLDHEVAWYGDPAFDLAFLMNHLYLKRLYLQRSNGGGGRKYTAAASDGKKTVTNSGEEARTSGREKTDSTGAVASGPNDDKEGTTDDDKEIGKVNEKRNSLDGGNTAGLPDEQKTGTTAKEADHTPELSQVVWNAYFDKLGNLEFGDLKPRTGRLLLMLMLARVDGKSPVEYLQDLEKQIVREFVYEMLHKGIFDQTEIHEHWTSGLNGPNPKV